MVEVKESATVPRPRIEGGVDAIVIGASLDGLAASALLARAGLKTVLMERSTEMGSPLVRRTLAEGVEVCDGEHLVVDLDPQLIDELDLYRHGLSYAARRLETTYFFSGGDSLRLGGDLASAAEALDPPAPGLGDFLGEALGAAADLREIEAAGASASQAQDRAFDAALTASAEDVIGAVLEEGRVRDAFLAEAAFRSAAAPHEPFSYSALLQRLGGEVSGLQGGIGYPAGGALAVIDAMRRAAQVARVDIRAGSPVDEILIEHDRAAGVALEDGGQVRSPIVISALDARATYLDLVGPASLNPAFHRILTMARPAIASAQLHLLLSAPPSDETTQENLRRRLVFAPSQDALRRAFVEAARGAIPDELILEVISPGALEADEKDQVERPQLSVIAHPLPLMSEPDGKHREEIRAHILAALESFAPAISEQIDAEALVLPADRAKAAHAPVEAFAAPMGVLRQAALAAQCAAAANIGGLYFCGTQAQWGYGLSGAAGRSAARAALRKTRRTGAAP